MPYLYEIRDAVLSYEGGYLGGFSGIVDADPDIDDLDAARSLISAKLYDGEKLSNAYGGHYFWIPKYADACRAEARGYRVRFITVFEPPLSGAFVLRFYGYGEIVEMPVGSPAEAIQQQVQELSEDLVDVDVYLLEDGAYEFHLPQRIGMGSSAGRLRAAGGLGLLLMNQDFSQPLAKGTEWHCSPVIPFETADGIAGIHTCINNALYDYVFDDQYPVEAIGNPSTRDRAIQIGGIAPGLQPEEITGYYAPTNWESVITFVPPSSGVYSVSLKTSVAYGPHVTPLAYNATGAELEAALRSISGVPRTASAGLVTVAPQGAASAYTITWRTMHHRATIVPTRGTVTSVDSRKLRETYGMSLSPYYQSAGGSPILTDPGYEEGVSWFVGWKRRGHTRVLPQTYPRTSDGTLDTDADPIPGTEWVDSMRGLENDLDYTFVPMEKLVPAAFRYCLTAIAAGTQGGDQARFEAKAHEAAVWAAGGVVYGPIEPRGNSAGRGRGWPPLGHKAAPFFASDY